MPGNRTPSSSVHTTTSTGARVVDAGVVHGAHRFEPGEHAVDAIEAAAEGLSIQMTAGHDGSEHCVAALPAGDDVAHAVDAHAAAGILAPGHEQVPGLAIELRERDTSHSAPGRRADTRHLHEALPEPIAVDARRSIAAHARSPVRTPRRA